MSSIFNRIETFAVPSSSQGNHTSHVRSDMAMQRLEVQSWHQRRREAMEATELVESPLYEVATYLPYHPLKQNEFERHTRKALLLTAYNQNRQHLKNGASPAPTRKSQSKFNIHRIETVKMVLNDIDLLVGNAADSADPSKREQILSSMHSAIAQLRLWECYEQPEGKDGRCGPLSDFF